jgi:arylsulfatase A-like enzyme
MKNNFLFIIFDSCRFDTFKEACTPNMSRLGSLEKRYSYASWTAPSHAVYLTGISPHKSPKEVFASEVYKKDFTYWSNRLNIPDISFKGFVPELSLPAFLKRNGYRTSAMVSLPVLNQMTIFNQHFDSYELMPKHNDFNAMIEKLDCDQKQPSFYFLNVGETHYPYTLPFESAENLPRIHGVHGVFKHMDDFAIESNQSSEGKNERFFCSDEMLEMRNKQKRNVEYLDRLFEKLYEKIPRNTHILVTSDHGELFGEDNYFGHGPIFHEKVFEVPFIEGKIQ